MSRADLQIIDAHVHYIVPGWLDRLWSPELRRSSLWPRLQLRQTLLADSAALVASLDARDGLRAVVYPELSVAPGPHIPGGAAAALAISREMNDTTAAFVRHYPDRLIGLAVANPLGGPDDLAELRRAVVALGLRGVAVGANYAGATIAAPEARPFLALAEALAVPVVIHPVAGGPWQSQRDFGLDLLLGAPTDVAATAIRLMFSGRLAEFPRLRIMLAHLGGSLLSLLGWLDVVAPAEGPRPEVRARRFWVDTASANPQSLALAVATLGVDRVLLGTDWPFVPPMRPGDPLADPIAMVAALRLTPEERAQIAGGAAAGLFSTD
jgi:aminocarboxymuconate-semialdehyde decarboxylase